MCGFVNQIGLLAGIKFQVKQAWGFQVVTPRRLPVRNNQFVLALSNPTISHIAGGISQSTGVAGVNGSLHGAVGMGFAHGGIE